MKVRGYTLRPGRGRRGSAPEVERRLADSATIDATAARVAGVVVPTHNDGGNLPVLLRRLLDEPCVAEVFVVASACTDGTVATVQQMAAEGEGRLRIHVEDTRSGKAAAVNLGFRHLDHPVAVVVSGDVLPAPGALGRIVGALAQAGVGLAGGRPLPLNAESTFLGHTVHLMWRLHHRIALERPKIGEVIAMRREAVVPLPPDSSVDEPWFQALLESAGWTPAYVPEAIISNRGPETARDYVKQRRRVHAGNLWLHRRQAYKVPSLRPVVLISELLADLRDDRRRLRPVRLARTAGAMGLEVWARLLARADYLRGKEHHVWDIVESAKVEASLPDGLGVRDGQFVAGSGLAPPVAREHHGEHEFPLQLQVRDVQRLRTEGEGARG